MVTNNKTHIITTHKMNLHTLANRISHHGQFIEAIDYYNQRIILYAVGSELYEVYYNSSDNGIEKIKPVQERDLTKFLNRIKLPIHRLY